MIDLLTDHIDGGDECWAKDGILTDLINTVESWKVKP